MSAEIPTQVEATPADQDSPPGRQPPWLWIHLATLLVAAVVLCWANRSQWFFGDEWEFLVNRGLVNPALGIFAPHNEHWSTLPILAYTLLRDTVGLASYWPYISLLIAIHLSLAHLMWRVMVRAMVAPAIAVAAAALFALFGAGAENLLWAFQIGFVGSLTAGWAAALVVDRRTSLNRRDGWAVLLLIAGLMCSGIGVPVVGFVSLLALARARSLVRPLVIGGIPAAVFSWWYFVVPQAPKPPWPAPIDDGPVALGEHVVKGIRDSLAMSTGLPTFVALAGLAVTAVWVLVQTVNIVRQRPNSASKAIAVAGMYGAAGFFVLSGFGRGNSVESRYVYVTMAMALPGLVLMLSSSARRRWSVAVVTLGLSVLIVYNAGLLWQRSKSEAAIDTLNRETIVAAVALIAAGEPTVYALPDPALNPDIKTTDLPQLIQEGLLTDAPTQQGSDRARLGLQIDPAGAPPESAGNPPRVDSWQNAKAEMLPGTTAGSSCLQVTAAGQDPSVDLVMPGGVSAVEVSSASGGGYSVKLIVDVAVGQRGASLAPSEVRYLRTSLPAGTKIRLTLAAADSRVCGVR